MSGGGKTSTSTSSVQIPPEVMARYNAVNQYAENVAKTPYQPYQGQFVAPMTETQNAAVANVNQAAGQAQPYFTGATESLLQGQQAATPYYGAAMQAYGGAYGLGAQLGQESYGTIQGAQAGAQPYNQAATGLALAGTQAVNPAYLGQGAINQYMSPYLGSVVGSTMEAMNQQNQQQQSQLSSDAIRSGAFGGDRAGVAAANLAYKQNLANQQTIANLYNTGYGQALATAQQQQGLGLGAQQANRAALQAGAGQMLGIGQQQFGQGAATAGQLAGLGQQQFGQGLSAGQQIAGLGQGVFGMGEKTAQNLAALGTGAQGAALQGASAQLAAGTQEQQTQQAQNTALYNQYLQQQGYPFQVAQFLANIAMGTGALSGSTTSSTQPASFFSDKRLKENVHEVGKTFDGQPIYRYNYKGERGTQIGLMAQDVEHKHPEAVGLSGGYKTVDYDRATKDAAHRGHFADGGASMGGGVVPERAGEGFALGGMPEDYFAQILKNRNAQPFGSGLGGQTQGLGIPTQSGAAPGKLMIASPPPAQPSTGDDLLAAAGRVKAVQGLAEAGQSALTGSAATDKTAASQGLLGSGGKFDTGQGYVADVMRKVRGYATDGRVNDEDAGPYGVRSFVPIQKPDIPALKSAQTGSGQSGGLGSDLAGAASLIGAGKTLGEGAMDLAKFLPALFLASGGVASRHGYATDGAVENEDTNNPTPPGLRPRQLGYTPMGDVTGYEDSAPTGLAGSKQSVVPKKPNEDTISPNITMPTIRDWLTHPITSYGDWSYQRAQQGSPKGSFPNPIPPNITPEAIPPEAARYPDLLRRIEEGAEPSAGGVVAPTEQAPRLPAARDVEARPIAPSSGPSGGVAPLQGEQGATQTPAAAPTAGLAQPPQSSSETPKAGGDWFSRNQDWLAPLLTGVGTMAASPSRYLGSAFAQGLAGAAGSYGNVQTQMAQREKIYADTTRQMAEASRYNFNPDTGLFSAWDNGQFRQIPSKEFFDRINAKDPTLSLVHPETKQHPAFPTGTQYTPPASLAPSKTGAGISPEAQQLVGEEISTLKNVIPSQAAAFSAAPDYKEIQMGSSSSTASKPQILQLIKNLQSSPAGGEVTSQYFIPIAQKANDLLRVAGLPEIINPEVLASAEATKKISAEFAAQMQRSGNSRAAAEFTSLLSTLPTNANSPEGKKKLSASMLITNQRPIDMQNFANDYKAEAIRQNINPIMLPHVGSNLNAAFSKDYTQQYEADVKNLENMYDKTIKINGSPVNTMQFLMDHARELSLPENARLKQYLEGLYGKTLRYF